MSTEIATSVITNPSTRNPLCNVSVHTSVRIPPRIVYARINARMRGTATQNGMPKGPKTNRWKTSAARKSRAAAPRTRDTRKIVAPVRCAVGPNRCPR